MRQSKVPATHDLFIDLAICRNTQSSLGLGHKRICCIFDVENDHRAYDRRASWKMQICSVIMLCDHIWRLVPQATVISSGERANELASPSVVQENKIKTTRTFIIFIERAKLKFFLLKYQLRELF